MNYKITPSSLYSSLIPALSSLAQSRGVQATSFEVEDNVLRAGGLAWDLGAEMALIHVQISQILTEKAEADAAAAIQAEADRLEREANYVPWAITNADLRRGLISSGINPQLITDYLISLPENSVKWTALADWEYSNYVERNHPMLDQLAPNFGLTSGDVNAIFRSKTEYPRI